MSSFLSTTTRSLRRPRHPPSSCSRSGVLESGRHSSISGAQAREDGTVPGRPVELALTTAFFLGKGCPSSPATATQPTSPNQIRLPTFPCWRMRLGPGRTNPLPSTGEEGLTPQTAFRMQPARSPSRDRGDPCQCILVRLATGLPRPEAFGARGEIPSMPGVVEVGIRRILRLRHETNLAAREARPRKGPSRKPMLDSNHFSNRMVCWNLRISRGLAREIPLLPCPP